MAVTKTYIPGEMAVIVSTAIITNWESLNVEYDEDFWNFYAGSGGEITRTKNSSRLGTITVEIPQTSLANKILSVACELGTLIPCSIVDPTNIAAHSIPEATVLRKPSAAYSKTEVSQREWQFKGSLDVNNI